MTEQNAVDLEDWQRWIEGQVGVVIGSGVSFAQRNGIEIGLCETFRVIARRLDKAAEHMADSGNIEKLRKNLKDAADEGADQLQNEADSERERN